MPNGGHTGSQNGGVIIRAFDIIFTILLIILSPIVRCNYRNFVTSILMSEADYDIYTTYMTKSGIREILSDFNIIINIFIHIFFATKFQVTRFQLLSGNSSIHTFFSTLNILNFENKSSKCPLFEK